MKYLFIIFVLFTVSCVEVEVEENPLLFFLEEMDNKYIHFEEKNMNGDSIKYEIVKYNPYNKYLLLNAMLSPNFWTNAPLFTGKAKKYLTFPSRGGRNFIANKLQADFPVHAKNRLINSFSVSYLLSYDNSHINNVTYKKLEEILSIGIIYDVTKLNVLLRE